MEEIKLNDDALTQLECMHQESGVDYSTIINSAINEYFHNFMAEIKRAEMKEVR